MIKEYKLFADNLKLTVVGTQQQVQSISKYILKMKTKIPVSRKCIITGATNTMKLAITHEELDRIEEGKELIQNIVPHLNADEREFLISGMTPETWEKTMGPEEDSVYDV